MKKFPRGVCPAHNKKPKFVRNEKAGYTYWQCPEGCWLDIEGIPKTANKKRTGAKRDRDGLAARR